MEAGLPSLKVMMETNGRRAQEVHGACALSATLVTTTTSFHYHFCCSLKSVQPKPAGDVFLENLNPWLDSWSCWVNPKKRQILCFPSHLALDPGTKGGGADGGKTAPGGKDQPARECRGRSVGRTGRQRCEDESRNSSLHTKTAPVLLLWVAHVLKL